MSFIYFWFFGIRLTGVTFTLVPPVKPDSPVGEDKEDVTEAVSLRCLRTTTYYGTGASDWEIMFLFCFSYLLFINSLSDDTNNVLYASVYLSSTLFLNSAL